MTQLISHPVAITNFWNLQEKNEETFDAIYRVMLGDAYHLKDINEALKEQGPNPDMSDYTYYPVIAEITASGIERHSNVKLSRKAVKRRPKVGLRAYEIEE